MPRLTLAGKFLLAICPFLITSSIGTAIYYVALHRGERAFEQAISEETTLDDAARDAASAAIRVAVGTLGYLRRPSEDQRRRAERARGDYWQAKTRYDQLWRSGQVQPERARLSEAFDRIATLSQSLIEREDAARPIRERVEAAEARWRESLKSAGAKGGPPSRQQWTESRQHLAELDAASAADSKATAAMAADVEEFLRLRDNLDDLLDRSHEASADLATSKQMAVVAAQKGITYVWIAALLQCTVGVAAILMLGRSVRRRIDSLTEATAAVSEGDLATRVPESGSDELTELTRGFNDMADQLERTTVSRAQLEEQEEALRLSEQRQRLLVESLKDCAIFTVDAPGKITSWNAGAERLYGYDEQEAIGAPLQTLYGEPSDVSAAHHLEIALASGGYAVDGTQLRKNGSLFLAEVSITPLDDVKRWGESVVLVRDVTAQRAAGLERQRHLDQLAHVGRLSVMGEMAAGFAHELNQPLGAISNYAEGCLMRMVDDELPAGVLRQILERISAEAQRAGDIIHRVRAFARKEETHSEAIDLADAIQHVADLLEYDAVHQGVDLHIDIAPDLAPISGDRIQIEQVLVNLLRNAFDAVRGSNGDGFSKQVILRARRNEEGDIHVSVEDNGCGIAVGDEAKSFDAFYTTKDDGLGMGLAISRTIIEAHGGRIWLSRNPGRGLTAHVTIPARAGRRAQLDMAG